MSVYLDTPFLVDADHPTAPRCFRGKHSAHPMADSTQELVEYAVKLGMKPGWIQHSGRATEHFDLTGSKLTRALSDPRVVKMSAIDMARMWTARRTTRTDGKEG